MQPDEERGRALPDELIDEVALEWSRPQTTARAADPSVFRADPICGPAQVAALRSARGRRSGVPARSVGWSPASAVGSPPYPRAGFPGSVMREELLTPLRFRLRAIEPGRLPAYPGFVLRGAFGRALRQLTCPRATGSDGDGCTPQHDCAYGRLFEPFAGRRAPYLAGQPAAPKPYLFEPLGPGGDLPTGAELAFRLVLLGSTGELAPVARKAVVRMGSDGLGASRCRFELSHMEAEDPPLPWPSFGASPAGAGEPAAQGSAPRAQRLRLLTPLRLVSRGQTLHHLDFPELIRRAAHRHYAVERLYGPDQPSRSIGDSDAAEHIEALAEHARRLDVEAHRVRWYDLHRYSGRQGRSHPLGGLVGEATLRGELAPLLPTLRAARWLHVGKGVSFGLGWVQLLPEEGEPAR